MYLTMAALQEQLHCSSDTLTRLIRAGTIRAIKLCMSRNSRYRIDEDSLRSYLREQAVQPADAAQPEAEAAQSSAARLTSAAPPELRPKGTASSRAGA